MPRCGRRGRLGIHHKDGDRLPPPLRRPDARLAGHRAPASAGPPRASGASDAARPDIGDDATAEGMLQTAGLLFFAFFGYARIATFGEEVRDPQQLAGAAAPLPDAAIDGIARVGGLAQWRDHHSRPGQSAPARVCAPERKRHPGTEVRLGDRPAAGAWRRLCLVCPGNESGPDPISRLRP
ncbi:hypothetical protein CG747_29105 [Streptomyces sp. CB02959]|nr:hypothetical protein CG747_29105 [Streptomyces sp. CB02959]